MIILDYNKALLQKYLNGNISLKMLKEKYKGNKLHLLITILKKTRP